MASVGSGQPYRIVVAEDEKDFLDSLCLLLDEDERFEVVGRAQDGRKAVELAQRVGPDLVVMDIEMPVLDGIEATRVLRECCPEVPVVAISGHDYEERVLEIREAGAVDYVRKSRVEEELTDVLASLLVPARTR